MAIVTHEHEHTSDEEHPPRRPPTASQVLLILAVLAALGTLLLWPLGKLPGEFEPEVGRVVFGNIPEALEAAFYVATATFLGVSLYLFSLRARNWQRGQSENRTGDWGARFKRLGGGPPYEDADARQAGRADAFDGLLRVRRAVSRDRHPRDRPSATSDR